MARVKKTKLNEKATICSQKMVFSEGDLNSVSLLYISSLQIFVNFRAHNCISRVGMLVSKQRRTENTGEFFCLANTPYR